MLDNKNFYNNFLKIAAIHHIQKGLIYVSIPFKGIFNFSNEYGGEKKPELNHSRKYISKIHSFYIFIIWGLHGKIDHFL